MDKNSFKTDLKDRLDGVKLTRWIRFGLVSVIFFLWVAWLGNWWVSLCWFLLFDIYITGYIPFTWWKKSPSATTRTVMSWVDAIVYALVLVYFVFAFIGQNYQIPSSSLEKTLLTGDYLWVNKMAYGPRVPMTPIHFPLTQNTLPLVNTKSYLEHPQFEYHRLKGLGRVKLGDIVVFNFPGGDTVALKEQNPDIYALSRMIGETLIAREMAAEPGGDANSRDAAVRALGMAHIRRHPDQFGEVIWRPVDRRENYVKRAVGLPGQTFEIRDGEIYNDGVQMSAPTNVQYNYNITFRPEAGMSRTAIAELLDRIGVSYADQAVEPGRSLPTPPLTAAMVEQLRRDPRVLSVERCEYTPESALLYPLASSYSNGWTLDNYGPIVIPSRGMTVKLDADGWATYGHAIAHYEEPTAVWRDGRAWINGQPADSYTFKMDYYFMMGDNRHKSLDSRFWGFVPEDHIVGRPEIVLISFDKDHGGIRWNRLFKSVKSFN